MFWNGGGSLKCRLGLLMICLILFRVKMMVEECWLIMKIVDEVS